MNAKDQAVIEGYRNTLDALEKLKHRKKREGATDCEMRLIDTEIEEVTDVLRHLLKGWSRYKWNW